MPRTARQGSEAGTVAPDAHPSGCCSRMTSKRLVRFSTGSRPPTGINRSGSTSTCVVPGRSGTGRRSGRRGGGRSSVAYVALTPSAEPGWWGMEIAVDPDHRSPETFSRSVQRRGGRGRQTGRERGQGLALSAAADRSGPQGRLRGRARTAEAGTAADRWLPSRPAPTPGCPKACAWRHSCPGRDEPAWLEVNNAAFVDHPENGRWTLEILENRMEQTVVSPRRTFDGLGWQRPGRVLLVEAGRRGRRDLRHRSSAADAGRRPRAGPGAAGSGGYGREGGPGRRSYMSMPATTGRSAYIDRSGSTSTTSTVRLCRIA